MKYELTKPQLHSAGEIPAGAVCDLVWYEDDNNIYLAFERDELTLNIIVTLMDCERLND